jgi:hypothetical protein
VSSPRQGKKENYVLPHPQIIKAYEIFKIKYACGRKPYIFIFN